MVKKRLVCKKGWSANGPDFKWDLKERNVFTLSSDVLVKISLIYYGVNSIILYFKVTVLQWGSE